MLRETAISTSTTKWSATDNNYGLEDDHHEMFHLEPEKLKA
jgi:hypothetical protein